MLIQKKNVKYISNVCHIAYIDVCVCVCVCVRACMSECYFLIPELLYLSLFYMKIVFPFSPSR